MTTPRANYAPALEAVTGQPVENLGFNPADKSTTWTGARPSAC